MSIMTLLVGAALLGFGGLVAINCLTWMLVKVVGPQRLGIDPKDIPDLRTTWWRWNVFPPGGQS